jgi:hypothetical protein
MQIVEGLTIMFVLFCAGLGAFGQFLRSVIGLYKFYKDDADPTTCTPKFNYKRYIVSLCVGAVIGAVVSLIYSSPLSNTDILGIVAASYGGTDFIEGLLTRTSPKV